MSRLLLDAAGILALLFQSEPQHAAAVAAYRRSARRVTHSFVIAELFALSEARGYPRATVVTFTNDLLSHPAVLTVWVDEPLAREAISLLDSRRDKSYSLCDAVSFILMRRSGDTDALTTDRHFEQEGFRRLLT